MNAFLLSYLDGQFYISTSVGLFNTKVSYFNSFFANNDMVSNSYFYSTIIIFLFNSNASFSINHFWQLYGFTYYNHYWVI